MDKELVAIQTRLREMGFDPGTVDGVWGPDTRKAVAAALGVKAKAPVPDIEAPWFDRARTQLGVREAPGTADNPQVADYFAAAVGKKQADSVPWCAAFAGAMLEETGYKGSGSLMARSYLQWGKTLTKPQTGCVVVLKRGAAPSGHVGFLVEATASNVKLLGGNQSNAVTIATFPRSAVLGFRWPVQAVAA